METKYNYFQILNRDLRIFFSKFVRVSLRHPSQAAFFARTVICIRHSRLAYRVPTFNQKEQTPFLGHMHAYEYFGGVADMRTTVEQVNSRLDTSFGFEKHTIRGLKKMYSRCCLALVVMLAMAVEADKGQTSRSDAQPAEGCLKSVLQRSQGLIGRGEGLSEV